MQTFTSVAPFLLTLLGVAKSSSRSLIPWSDSSINLQALFLKTLSTDSVSSNSLPRNSVSPNSLSPSFAFRTAVTKLRFVA